MIVIVAIAKNEAPYLLEWIAHHQALGVDHFLIFDNDSSDDTGNILRALTASGDVTGTPWPTRDEYPLFEGVQLGPQVPAYQRGVEIARASGRWTWMGCLDLDEFVVLERQRRLGDFLQAYWRTGAVGLNWRMYGSSGLKTSPPGLMTKSFVMRASDDWPVNRHVKTFARLDCIQDQGIHIPRLKPGFSIVDTEGGLIDPVDNGLHSRIVYSGAWINHYYTKSEAEFERKRQRGRVSKHLADPERIRSPDEFTWSNQNQIRDVIISRFELVTQKKLRRLNKIVRAEGRHSWWERLKHARHRPKALR